MAILINEHPFPRVKMATVVGLPGVQVASHGGPVMGADAVASDWMQAEMTGVRANTSLGA